MIRRPPSSTLFPDTTLSRSGWWPHADHLFGAQLRPSLRDDGEGSHHLVVFVLHDVAVVYVALRPGDALGQIELGADGGEVARVGFDRVLEAALVGCGWLHRAGGERLWAYSAGHPRRATVFVLVCLDVERGAADHLEGDQVHVHRVGVTGHVHPDPVLHGAGFRGLGPRFLLVVD